MDDLISRQAAIDALAEMYCKSDEDGYVWIIRSDAWSRIDALPSAESERKAGRWIPHDCLGRPSIDNDVCSECKQRFYQIAETGCEWNYCPNCGAKMEVEHE